MITGFDKLFDKFKVGLADSDEPDSRIDEYKKLALDRTHSRPEASTVYAILALVEAVQELTEEVKKHRSSDFVGLPSLPPL